MGFIEPVELEVIGELGPSPTVVDVGAFEGEFTRAVLDLRPDAQIVASEANPDMRRVLEQRFHGRVSVVPALGASIDVLDLYTDVPMSVLATFHPRWHVREVQMVQAGQVEVTTLAAVLDERAIDHVDLLKLDCEGHEYDALRGALPVLDRIATIYWEYYHEPATRYVDVTLADFERLLDGFRVEPLRPVDQGGGCLYVARRIEPCPPS